MALSNAKQSFSVCSVAPYNRASGEFHGILRVLGSSSLSLSTELVKSTGGCNPFPWSVAQGLTTGELSLTFREYPSFVYNIFLGAPATVNSAEPSGNASVPENKTGILIEATTGIADIDVEAGSELNLKVMKYVVKSVSSTTVDIFASSFADFGRGSDLSYIDDSLKIASGLTVSDAGGATSIPNTGLEILGGSGVVSMTIGDTCVVETRPINSGSHEAKVGASSNSLPEFGAIVISAKDGGALNELDLYRCKAGGMPLGFDENAHSESSVTAECFYDSERDGVFSMRRVED